MTIDSQNTVDEVDDIGPHHGNLVYDDEFHGLKQFYVTFPILEKVAYLAWRKLGIIGDKRIERKLEETMQRTTFHIDSRDACGCKHHMFLLHILAHVPEKRAFTRSGLASQKY